MLKRGLVILSALTLVACGGDELEPEDAQVAWESTQQALNGGTSSGGPNSLLGTSYVHQCQDGGKAKFSYNVGSAFSGTANSASVEWEVKFKRCKVDGVVMRGNLTFTITTKTTDTSTFVEWNYTGDLRYRGDIKGTCLIDMTGRAGTTQNSASFSYEGSICGNDASATLNVDSDGASNSVDGETF